MNEQCFSLDLAKFIGSGDPDGTRQLRPCRGGVGTLRTITDGGRQPGAARLDPIGPPGSTASPAPSLCHSDPIATVHRVHWNLRARKLFDGMPLGLSQPSVKLPKL